MTPLQEKLLQLFLEVDEICRNNDIEYYMAGGSCIGAVRHHGFIPWDDDIDIYMTTSNWNRFIEYCRNNLAENRKLLCQEIDRNYTNVFGRYCDLTTTQIHTHSLYTNEPSGVVIDIIPIDPVSIGSKGTFEKYCKLMAIYEDLIVDSYRCSYRWGVSFWKLLWYYFKSIFLGKERVLKIIEDSIFNGHEDECTHYAMRWGWGPLLFPKEWFERPKEGIFEGYKCMLPTHISDYMIMHYGDDWFYIPEKHEQVGHNAVVDLKRCYKSFRTEYREIIPCELHGKIVGMYGVGAKLFLSFTQNIRLSIKKKEVLNKWVKVNIDEIVTKHGVPLTLYLSNDFDALRRIYDKYEKIQFDKFTIGREDGIHIWYYLHPVLIEVEDWYLDVFLKYCVKVGKHTRIMRLFDVKKYNNATISDTHRHLVDVIKLYRQSVNAEENGKLDEALKLIQRVDEEYLYSYLIGKQMINLLLKKESFDKAKYIVDRMLEIFSNDGELLYYSAFIQKGKLEEDSYYELLYEAKKKTKNGFLLKKIESEMLEAEYNPYLHKAEMEFKDCIEPSDRIAFLRKNVDYIRIINAEDKHAFFSLFKIVGFSDELSTACSELASIGLYDTERINECISSMRKLSQIQDSLIGLSMAYEMLGGLEQQFKCYFDISRLSGVSDEIRDFVSYVITSDLKRMENELSLFWNMDVIEKQIQKKYGDLDSINILCSCYGIDSKYVSNLITTIQRNKAICDNCTYPHMFSNSKYKYKAYKIKGLKSVIKYFRSMLHRDFWKVKALGEQHLIENEYLARENRIINLYDNSAIESLKSEFKLYDDKLALYLKKTGISLKLPEKLETVFFEYLKYCGQGGNVQVIKRNIGVEKI
ncbi:LicD family protein [Butyrivibrio sp. INlla14]|uniref:LicD family protein n=1 Tax=Butyrivibrio sp. INlla14 TaxID=1520808 RepID=UPI000875FFF4|nr:LicD family protein [Butyrivibrio sp. INlla14]SCY74473.1 Phosphorylcholine metabolism protein LicD [Butyrivibrio sp. INlla14]